MDFTHLLKFVNVLFAGVQAGFEMEFIMGLARRRRASPMNYAKPIGAARRKLAGPYHFVRK
jgi:hypothetical protein